MNRIIVIGCPGSGKSTFSRRLADFTGLPLIHLDMIYHKADKTTLTKEEFDMYLDKALLGEKWIIDGNYLRTMHKRLDACDTVIWLDYPIEVCLQGATSRIGKPRSDMPWTETEVDTEFLQSIKNFNTESRPEILSLLKNAKDKKVFVFKSRAEGDEFLYSFQINH